MILSSALLSALAVASPAVQTTLETGCEIHTQLSLPSYQAAQSSQGDVTLVIRCINDQQTYRLNWPSADVAGGYLRFELSNGLRLNVQDTQAQLSGQKLFMGPQQLRFKVQADAGQWGVARSRAELPQPVLLQVTQAGSGQ